MAEWRGAHRDEDEPSVGDHVDVIALILGRVGAPRRAEMAEHLLTCSSCRREYDEMSSTIAELLPAVPEIQPPMGFDQRVLARFRSGASSRSRSTRRTRLMGSAAAVLALVVGALGWSSLRDQQGATAGDVSPLELVDGGDHVGTVSIGEVDGETVMVVAVVKAPDGVSYRCVTTFADGTTSRAAAWPRGNGAWIVPLPNLSDSEIATVELVVNGTDQVWSEASFGDDEA